MDGCTKDDEPVEQLMGRGNQVEAARPPGLGEARLVKR